MITAPERLFLEPATAKHRQYEALRACFVEKLPPSQAAPRFGYGPATLRVMCSKFRHNPSLAFFFPSADRSISATKPQPRKVLLREKIVALRKQNLSVYDIAQALAHDATPLTPVMVGKILHEQGFARLPRRKDEERLAQTGPVRAAKADVALRDLSPHSFHTKFGGLFLFLHYLAKLDLPSLVRQAGLPGTAMVPALQALLALLALKLFGNARHSHVMSYVLDEGLALFSGLNVSPKRSFLTEYSCRIDPAVYPRLMRLWFDRLQRLGLKRGHSLDLDFHTIPFHGQDALVEKHYVSKRSRRQKGLLAFLARDAEHNVFCYANAEIRKSEQADEILRFLAFWKERTGHYPEELVFDSRLTTYANLYRLDQMGIRFITLRRRSRQMVQAIHARPLSAWRRITLPNLARQFRTPRILDERVGLRDYPAPLRQMTITDLGHEEPTLLLTNHLTLAAPTVITRYAQRMIIENQIADSIDFFHMDALSSAVAMKVNCDLQLTLMASSLYRLLACQIGEGYPAMRSRTLFQHFVDATAQVHIGEKTITVRFQKRARNPFLLAAGFAEHPIRIPWLDNRKLQLVFG
jgi:hypothetical protein